MRITLTKHGGQTAGMRLPAHSIDAASLDPQAAAKLTSLVDAAMASRPDAAQGRPLPDAMTYTITVDGGGESTTLKEREPNLSPPFAELVDYLEQLRR